MYSRRRFFGVSGLGMLALSTDSSIFPGSQPVYGDNRADGILRQRAKLKALKHRLVGYPINMNDPPPEFFGQLIDCCRAIRRSSVSGRFRTATTNFVLPLTRLVSNTLTSSHPSQPRRFSSRLNFRELNKPP